MPIVDDKAKLLADLKAGAVNVVALRPIASAAEQEAFDQVMGKLRSGISWLGLATGKGNAIFYEWPLSERLAQDYDDLARLLKEGKGYSLLHIEELGIMAQVLGAAEALLQEKQIVLLFDYNEAPGAHRIVSFYVVPMEGFTAHDPGFQEVIKKIRGDASAEWDREKSPAGGHQAQEHSDQAES